MSHRLLDLGLVPMGKAFRPTSPLYIQRIEERWGLQLPTVYRDFLLQFGVCAFADPVALRLPDGSWVDIHIFLGNDPDDSYDLSQSMQRLREFSFDPWLPFATDPGGNMFCLDLCSADQARVRYVGADGQLAAVVARSFSDFVDALRRLPA